MKLKELTDGIKSVTTEVAKFDQISAGIAALEKAHPRDVACDCASTAGMKQAIAGRAAWRAPRLAVEAARKTAKQPVLELGRQIDVFAKELTTTLLLGEEHYDEQIQVEEKRKKEAQAAKAEAERQRVQAIHQRIASFTFPESFGLNPPANIEEALEALESNAPQEAAFQEFLVTATVAHEQGVATLRRMLTAARSREALLVQEQEERRAEAERLKVEQAALKAEREELNRLRAEEAKRQAAAKAEDEARKAAERAELEKEQKRLRDERMQAAAEQERLDEEAAQRRDAEDRAAAAARAKIDAEAKAERDKARAALEEERKTAELAAEQRRQSLAREAAEKAKAEREAEACALAARTRLEGAAQLLLEVLVLAVPFVTDPTVLATCNAAIAQATGE